MKRYLTTIAIALCVTVLTLDGGDAHAARPEKRFGWRGVSSCSAQPCHGDVKADTTWSIRGNEVTTWIEQDRHADAYRVLANQLSKQIAARLKLDRPAHQSDVCLGCHSPDAVGRAKGAASPLAEGVGCEACHGAAEKWLAPHSQAPWKGLTALAKSEQGMCDTRNLYSRAEACAACHVGADPEKSLPGGDVNHDLIAAGHPALKFELTAYLAKMPKHWDERPVKQGTALRSDFEAQAWVVGQAASAAAALDLLAFRTEDKSKPWPEFAEFDCYSCHHQLFGPERPQQRDAGRAASSLGLPAWGTWYLPLTSVLPDGDGEALKSAASLRQLLQRPRANREQIRRSAAAAVRQFAAWGGRLADENSKPFAIDRLLARVKEQAPTIGRWDGEAQLYLALVALHYAKHGGQKPPSGDPITLSLRRAREELMFPSSGERRFDGPRNLDTAAAMRERLLPEIDRLLSE